MEKRRKSILCYFQKKANKNIDSSKVTSFFFFFWCRWLIIFNRENLIHCNILIRRKCPENCNTQNCILLVVIIKHSQITGLEFSEQLAFAILVISLFECKINGGERVGLILYDWIREIQIPKKEVCYRDNFNKKKFYIT